MRQDEYGQYILTESELCDLYLRDPERKISHCFTPKQINFDADLELQYIPDVMAYAVDRVSVAEFDKKTQKCWYMPAEYQNLDIAEWILDQCRTDEQRQRVGQELLLYMERDMFDLLRYLKYIVDTMRVNNIVWGVGRGSSVASYVLYIIGVHKIDSMYYNLDVAEFLR